MLVSQLRHHPSTRSTFDEALHDEEWLVYLFHRSGILTDGGSYRGDAHRTSTELVDDGQQDAVVYFVQSVLVDVQCLQRYLGDVRINLSRTLHLGEVAYTAQQGIGDTGRTT